MRQKQKLEDTRKPISEGEVYPLGNFMQYTGWGRHALMQARKQGLRCVKVAGRVFIRGKDFSEFLSKLEAE